MIVDDLHTQFRSHLGLVHAVDGISWHVDRGETLGVVGESGCGKSVAALSILRLIPDPPGRVVKGAVHFDDKDLLALPESAMQSIRGNEISMVFQEPMTSLNPVLTIGQQIGETMMIHQGCSSRAAQEKTVEMLRMVHIPEPERRIRAYPHQLSGGMRQRVMIAMALSCNPKILIADEPTTALDVTIQAQILDLMRELQDRLGTAIILITHDMGVIAENARRVIVMYAGCKVEEADTKQLFASPRHPYTKGLLTSIPTLDLPGASGAGQIRLNEIPGVVPRRLDRPAGCLFEPRCRFATERCRRERPQLEERQAGHWAACWNSERLLETGA